MRRFNPWLLCSLLLLVGCQQDAAPDQRGLIYCSEGSPLSFNPHMSNSGMTLDATAHPLYDRLLDINPHTQLMEPALATAWQVSEDRRTYRLTLRRDVQFHHTAFFTPTRAFNAHDVVFTFMRMLDEQHPYHTVSGGNYPFFYSQGLDELIERVSANGDNEVVFTLARPNSAFISLLASDFMVITSAEYGAQLLAQNKPAQLDKQPIGTGPFLFKEYRRLDFIRYLRHESYWGSRPKIEQLVYDITPRSSRRLAKIMSGACDVMSTPVANQLPFIQAQPQLNLSVQSGMNVAYLALNTHRPPFNDVRVRQAIASAIDTSQILDAVYFETGIAAQSLLPPQSWGFNPNLKPRKRNIAHAKQLLKEAGYADGFTMEVLAHPHARAYNPDAVKTAQLLRRDLAKVGIKLDLVRREWAVIRRRVNIGEYDSVLTGWMAQNAEPDNFLRQLLSCAAIDRGNNVSRWCSPAFDQLLDDALATEELAQRLHNYYAAQELLSEQMPVIPLAHAMRTQVKREEVQGVQILPFIGTSFRQSYKE
ncbi:MAG: ABC transporter substrate-binding protein [Aeromonas sp.]